MKFCVSCGGQLVPEAKFCGNCGTMVPQPVTAEALVGARPDPGPYATILNPNAEPQNIRATAEGFELYEDDGSPLEPKPFFEAEANGIDPNTIENDTLANIRANYSPADVAEAAKALLARLIEEARLQPASASGVTVPQMLGDEAEYDKTQLSMLMGDKLLRIHRDYLAHAIRYEFLIQRVKASGSAAMILDIGCGDVPLMRAIRSSMLSPKLYYGMEVRPYEVQKVLRYYSEHKVHFPFEVVYGDFTEAAPEVLDQPWTQVVCLEVLEHMPRGRGQMLLRNLKRALTQGGDGFLSTPCFDGKSKAQRHPYEWGYGELEQAFTDVGLEVVNRWGTFSNVRNLYKALTPEEKIVWDGLDQRNGQFYGNIALSLIFSPLHPEAARNCIWHLRAKREGI